MEKNLLTIQSITLNPDYKSLLRSLKQQIASARIRAALSINKELIQLYWSLGQKLIDQGKTTPWGDKLLEQLSNDLKHEFPEMRGFSKTNLKYMRLFAQCYPEGIGQQLVDQLPWGHLIVLIRLKIEQERQWYIKEYLQNGWSRATLENYIKEGLYARQGLDTHKASNFLERLPLPHSQVAHDLLKSPYNFDFLGLHDNALERDIENGLIEHVTKFLMELGRGFAFVGKQVSIELGDSEYIIDILMYNLKLHAYVVVELKATRFKPEHAGQLNFYLNLVDDFYKMPEDNPTIGLLLCKSRNKFEAEYALKGINKPMGVSEYELTRAVPENFKATLPSIEEIETELNESEGGE